MIELIILNYLNENLPTGIKAYMQLPEVKKPSNNPSQFVVIEKTGSSVENFIWTSTFAIQSYAETLYKAAQLNEVIKNLMRKAEEDDVVIAARLNSDYNFTDSSTKQPRYQAVFDFIHYERKD